MTSHNHPTPDQSESPTPEELRFILADAIRAARIGGEVDQHYFGTMTPEHTTLKESRGDWNPVTHADQESETAITNFLARAYPDHSFLGEENVAGRHHSAEHLWIIDPIDGTANFIHGIPHYGVAVGYAYHGTVLAAACLDPERNELFTAIRGAGAYLNGTRIHASATTAVEDAMVCTGFYYDRGAMMEATLDAIRALFQKKIHGLRRSGSSVLDICWTAAGRYDAYFEYELGAWDYAAAGLIAEEAGVRIAAADGSPLTLASGSMACATAPLYEQFIETVRRR